MALPSAGNASMPKSYASTVVKPTENSSFKIPMQFPVEIDGELGFVFS